jgi:hypothetical protein
MPANKIFCSTRRFALLALVSVFVWESSRGQGKQAPCPAPIEWAVEPKFSESDVAKWKDMTVTTTALLQVSEAGDILHVNLLSVKPEKAGKAVVSAMQRAKFRARPGCGNWLFEISFKLHGDALQDKEK